MRVERLLGALVLLTLGTVSALESPQDRPVEGLRVEPASVTLAGPDARQQIVVSWVDARGDVSDVTRDVSYSYADDSVVSVTPEGVVVPRSDGLSVVTARLGDLEAKLRIAVNSMAAPRPVSFRHTVIALLAKHGCNSGACHGSPKGKNGFRLSLRGHDPDLDIGTLTRESRARRTSLLRPDESLMLLKALGAVAHQGGKRFSKDSRDYGLLREWIATGLLDDRDGAAKLERIEVYPPRRSLRPPAVDQQLVVTAHFADGTRRDVTEFSVFTTSDDSVAEVDSAGFVRRRAKGDVAILVRYLEKMATARLTYLPESPNADIVYPQPNGYIDRLVFEKLRLLGIPLSSEASDSEFIRRVYLDTVALLPSPKDVRRFLSDDRPDKRARLIDDLLERPEFSDYWSMKWLDVLSSSRKNLGPYAVHRFQRWIRQAIAARVPLDEVARSLLTAGGDVNVNPAANYYRVSDKPHELAEISSQLFLGIRMECARCHNHPFERWTQDDYYGMTAFFSGVRIKGPGPKPGGNNSSVKADRQIVWFDERAPRQKHPTTGDEVNPVAFGAAIDGASETSSDPRPGLARWVTSPENPFFTACLSNRIWYHLVGRGIVDPVDDFRESNPPSNDELLSALSADLVAHDYDLRHLVRTILNSKTYQRSSRTVAGNESDVKYFSHSIPRLLSAEQLLDALCEVSGVPETYPGFPPGTRAVQLPDPGIDHGFLAAFGKPQRNIACECEREGDGATISQALEMVRGDTVHSKIRQDNNRLGVLIKAEQSDEQIVTNLYLSAIARVPKTAELEAAIKYLTASKKRREGLEDLLWALFNSKEFLFRR